MAKSTVTVITCDHCGTDRGTITTTGLKVTGLDGGNVEREMDLCDKGRKEFGKAIAAWTTMGVPVRSTSTRASKGSARRPSRDLGKIREWAKANGHEVSDRGRVPSSVMEAYDAAH